MFTTESIDHLIRANLWSSDLIEIQEHELMGLKYVKMITDFPDGDTLNIPSIGQMEAQDYAENQAIRYTAMVTKIISGFQTGGDRGGSYAAEALGLETGGTVPKGRRADDGEISLEDMARFHLKEHSSSAYPPRTEANVRDSDGTVLFGNMSSPGCSLTIRLCHKHQKPAITNPTAEQLRRWVEQHDIQVLNVAGNRERTNRGIFQRTYDTVVEAFKL